MIRLFLEQTLLVLKEFQLALLKERERHEMVTAKMEVTHKLRVAEDEVRLFFSSMCPLLLDEAWCL